MQEDFCCAGRGWKNLGLYGNIDFKRVICGEKDETVYEKVSSIILEEFYPAVFGIVYFDSGVSSFYHQLWVSEGVSDCGE